MMKKEHGTLSDTELDDLLRDFDLTIRSMSNHELAPGVGTNEPNQETILSYSKAALRPNLPDHRSPNFIWRRPDILPTGSSQLNLENFLMQLQTYANLFVWNDFTPDGDQPIRAWSKLGYTFDPVTAVCLASTGVHYSLCVSDIAGLSLGLSDHDAKLLAYICWNWHPEQLSNNHEAKQLRAAVIVAIEKGA